MAVSINSAALPLLGACLAYWVVRAIYRVTFHPLARFPGPKFAAVSHLYACWYDLRYATSLVKKLPELHDKYGPIVRILPNQLHCRDMDSYNQIYKPGTKFKKDPGLYYLPFLEGSMFNKHETKLAKPHKDMYQPYFSRAAIQRLEHDIWDKVVVFLGKLGEASDNSKVVDLTLGYKCLTADVVMGYCYQKTFGALDAPDFQFPLIIDFEEFFASQTFSWYFQEFFKNVFSLLDRLPRSWVDKTANSLAAIYAIQDGCKERIVEMQAELPTSESPSVFRTALRPDREKGQCELNLKGLSADALLFFVAGTDTTAHALTCGTYFLTRDPTRLAELRKELVEAIPEVTSAPKCWAELERLPYLRGVIKESLRFSMGVPGRLPRIVPETGAVFCGQQIPPTTVVSHSAYVYHFDANYFANPFAFEPERWLGANSNELENRLVSFSRGTRGCLGINLAYAELYITFAYVFRKYDFTLNETTEHDMEWHDAFTPATFGHLKVNVRPFEEGKPDE